MKLSELDYDLPKELIAQFPANPRDHSKLMVIDKKTGKISHKHFYDLPEFLTSNDVLVFNKTKVFPARVFGSHEILLLKNLNEFEWEIMIKGKTKIYDTIKFDGFECEIISKNEKIATAKFNIPYLELLKTLEKIGKTPFPPYIHSKQSEEEIKKEYQTVYAEILGSAAAPTAGLHFTKELIDKIRALGVQIEFVTLHVGLGTFEPVQEKKLEDHKIHEEYFEIDNETIERLNKAKTEGKRIVAVGTTTTRVLETIAEKEGFLGSARNDKTSLYILPGFKFKYIDALITNFHLPKSTLIALVYAFNGQELTKKAYKTAIEKKYRFFSFGDAMLIK